MDYISKRTKIGSAAAEAENWEEQCKSDFLQWQDLDVKATCEASVLQPGGKIGGKSKVYRIALSQNVDTKAVCIHVMRAKGSNVNKYILNLNDYVSVVVDAQPDDDEQIFSLSLDNQPWYFQVTSFKRKIQMVSAIIKAAESGLPQNVAFEALHIRSLATVSIDDDNVNPAALEAYEEVSAREARYLRQIIGENSRWFQNGVAYTASLSKDLDTIERAQVVTIMQSEQVTVELQQRIDEMLRQVDVVAKKIRMYDTELALMRPDVARLLKRDKLYTIQSTNYEKLRNGLNNLLELLDAGEIERKYSVLKDGESDLYTDHGRQACLEAAKSLTNAKDLSLQSGMSGLSAVATTVKMIQEREDSFVKRLRDTLSKIISKQAGRMPSGATTSLPSHRRDYQELLPFRDLVNWLKSSQYQTFEWVISTYSSSMGTRYSREMEQVDRALLAPLLSRTSASGGGSTGGGGLGQYNPANIVEADLETSRQLYEISKTLMGEISLYFQEERVFCTEMFLADSTEEDAASNKTKPKFGPVDVQNSLNRMFSSLPSMLDKFLDLSNRLDRLNAVSNFLVLFDAVQGNKEGPKSIVTSTLATRQVDVKRKITALMNEEAGKYEEQQTIRSKVGRSSKHVHNVFPFCHNFPVFARAVEAKLFGQRCHEVDKSLCTLAQKLLQSVESVAGDSSLIKFENYHFISHELKLLKLKHLDGIQKDAQARYKQHIDAYVKQNLGHPMEKLSKFMRGIQSLVDSGVKESEISFQLQYSRQNLKKLLMAYPNKEVKKGLVSTYKKVERDMGSTSSQLQVVWRYMQDDFIAQYQAYDQIIQKCYPNTGLQLDFTVKDLLSYFSSIAASH